MLAHNKKSLNKSEGDIQNHTRTFGRQPRIPVNHLVLCTLSICSEVPVCLVFVLIDIDKRSREAFQENVLSLCNLCGSTKIYSMVVQRMIPMQLSTVLLAYHARQALTRQRLLVHVELVGDVVGQGRLILELWAQPCSRHPLASRLAVRTTIGARTGHHIHLKGESGRKGKEK